MVLKLGESPLELSAARAGALSLLWAIGSNPNPGGLIVVPAVIRRPWCRTGRSQT
jgi:hypothetical protein